jgi:hypothetical protein
MILDNLMSILFKRIKIFMIIFILLLLAGCYPVKYLDVSKEEVFQDFVGMEMETKEELLALGVTFDANYKQNVDYVYIMPKPGISGPEVVFKYTVPAGTKFRISGVLEQNNFFGNRYLYKLNIINTDFLAEYFIVLKISKEIDLDGLGINEDDFMVIRDVEH